MPFDRRVDGEDVVHVYKGMFLSLQKGWMLTLYIDVDGTGRDSVE